MSAAEPGPAAQAGHGDDDGLEFQAARKGSAEELLDADAHDPLDPMRHSAAHVMAEAVMDLFPGTKLGIGPAIEGGFYYDFELPRPLTPEDLGAIEARMRGVDRGRPSLRAQGVGSGRGACLPRGAGQPYKVEILDDLRTAAAERGEAPPPVSTYEHGPFIDLCRGPHVASTGHIGPFKLLSVAGAYWRGREDRPMLQRIYGTVWATQEELDLYLWRREEARKRDHRRLGVALDLFSFHDVSPGLGLLAPQGLDAVPDPGGGHARAPGAARLPGGLHAATRAPEALGALGALGALPREHVPGRVRGADSQPQAHELPGVTFIYRSRVRSYRELPLRLSEYGRLHRNELSGVLSGLTRVRHFVTDDAHIFVRPDQIGAEIEALLGEVREAYAWFGLEPSFTFGTRPEKALGDAALWEHAEALMREALDRSGMRYRVKEGDGAFYAPKIDIQVEDALGREWQTATIQVDLVMLPERFDLTYVDEQGQHVRPVAIHRAIYGSLERFIGILVEHFAGAFPFWCAPVQAVIVPIADRHVEAAGELAAVLRARGIRVEVDDSSNRMQNKIRLAQEQKVPYMLVLGDREVEARTAAPRTRGGEQLEPLGWEALADRLAAEAAERRPD